MHVGVVVVLWEVVVPAVVVIVVVGIVMVVVVVFGDFGVCFEVCGVFFLVAEEAFHAFAGFLFFGLLFLAVDEVGQPDADFVEDDHGSGHEGEGEHVRRGGEDGGEDEDGNDGVAAGACHGFVGQEAEFDDDHDDDGEFERESEEEGEAGGEGDVFTDAPVVGDAEGAAPFEEEAECAGEDEEVGEGDAAEEESEADGECGPEDFAFVVVESWQDELEDVHEEEGE